MRRQVNGILLLDKSPEISSNHALQQVKKLFAAKKAGHTGSLDPIATGMLPICFGEATKFSQFLLESNKIYRVIAKVGIQTSTGDREGEVIKTLDHDGITEARLAAMFPTFTGPLDQIPPMHSAIKYKGQPLYKLARKGIEIERKARRVNIFQLTLERFQDEYFTFTVHCSKGTYIRTLVEDICQALGTVGHVWELRRLNVSPYSNTLMYTLPALSQIFENAGMNGLLGCLLPVESAVQIYPAIKLSASAAFYLRMGQSVRATCPLEAPFVRLMSEDAKFLGIGEVMKDARVKPHRLLSQPLAQAS